MIRWITDRLGTASYYYYEQVRDETGAVLIDVRELTDKEGNADDALRREIERAVEALGQGKRVVVCCDMGISRSNAVAVGVLMGTGLPYEEAKRNMSAKVDVSEINLALLRQVRALFQGEREGASGGVANVLVTGSTGYVGAALARALGGEYNLSLHRRNEPDLAHDTASLDSFVNDRRIDYVVHLAHPRARNNLSAMGEAVAMMKNVLEVCRLNGLGLLFLSSLAVYSGHGSDEVLKTGPDLKMWPKGAYGETKYICEELIRLYRENYGLTASVIRPAAVYGPGMPRSTFFSKFFDAASRGATIRTHRYLNGEPTFDFLHLDDLLDAVRRCMLERPIEPMHIGTGRATSTYELARMISALCGRGSEVETVEIKDKTYKIVVDPTEASARLGWEPKVNLESGLEELLREYA